MSFVDEELEKCTTIEELIQLANMINGSIKAVEEDVEAKERQIKAAQIAYDQSVTHFNQLKQGKIDVMKKLSQYLGLKAFI